MLDEVAERERCTHRRTESTPAREARSSAPPAAPKADKAAKNAAEVKPPTQKQVFSLVKS